MEIHLSDEQQAFIREGIASGRLQKPEDAFGEAMSLWEERERRRIDILAAVQASEASLARGRGRRIASREQAAQLAEDVMRRGIDRLAAEKKTADG
jgi:Arc/MetJ-type ribon-helix-helix transcriptional regulator